MLLHAFIMPYAAIDAMTCRHASDTPRHAMTCHADAAMPHAERHAAMLILLRRAPLPFTLPPLMLLPPCQGANSHDYYAAYAGYSCC